MRPETIKDLFGEYSENNKARIQELFNFSKREKEERRREQGNKLKESGFF